MSQSNELLSILDVGCAQAILSLLLAERENKVVAVDLRHASLNYGQSRYQHGDLRFIKHNVLELQLDEKFDLIYASQLVEHLVYPQKMTQPLSAMLKPNGKLVIATPNHSYAISKHPNFKESADPKGWEHLQFSSDGDGYFFAHSQEELSKLFRSSGLQKSHNS